MSENEELFDVTSMFQAFMKEISKDWSRHGHRFNLTQFKILFLLDRKGALKVSELAHDLRLTSSAVTGITDQLVKEKYVKKERAENDRRVVYISLTPKGLSAITEIKTNQKEMLHVYFDVLADEDIQHLKRIFSTLLKQGKKKERDR